MLPYQFNAFKSAYIRNKVRILENLAHPLEEKIPDPDPRKLNEDLKAVYWYHRTIATVPYKYHNREQKKIYHKTRLRIGWIRTNLSCWIRIQEGKNEKMLDPH
jgi:hypothetical protein